MRIASLLPSATEIVAALGLADQLVAVTHECDYPPEVQGKPHVTRSLLPTGLPSALVDLAVRGSERDAHTIYALDAERLLELGPDVVLTQSLCGVCAVPRSAVDAAVCSMPRRADVVSLDPRTLDEMLDSVLVAGEHLGVRARAEAVVAELRACIEEVSAAVRDVSSRPRVVCCEWLDPLYCAGHWVPEQVRLAGGAEVLGRESAPSRRVEWDMLVTDQPQVLVLMPCGYNAEQTAARAGELARRPSWMSLPAVREGRVFAVDGSAYFSRPGPRLVGGVELLARIFHPEVFGRPAPAGAALRLVAGGRWEPYR